MPKPSMFGVALMFAVCSEALSLKMSDFNPGSIATIVQMGADKYLDEVSNELSQVDNEIQSKESDDEEQTEVIEAPKKEEKVKETKVNDKEAVKAEDKKEADLVEENDTKTKDETNEKDEKKKEKEAQDNKDEKKKKEKKEAKVEEKVPESQEIYRDVIDSGYWVPLCIDIQKAWEVCVPNSEENKKLAEEQAVDKVKKCNEEKDSCHMKEDENQCRNHALEYLSWVNDSPQVYVALLEVAEFRSELHSKCSLGLKLMDGYGAFKPKFDAESDSDELLQALGGGPEDQEGVSKPNEWLHDADKHAGNFKFEKDMLLPDTTTEIQGKFTADLDLTYSEDDVFALFDYKEKKYEKICKLAVKILKAKGKDDSEKLVELNQKLTEMPTFNYLTEEEFARKKLYNTCLMDERNSEKVQSLITNSQEAFDLLFK